MTARAVLDGIKARLAAATPGPWEFVGSDIELPSPRYGVVMETSVDCGSYCYGGSARQDISEGNRALIESAPSDVARLTAAVDAVLALAEAWHARGEHDMAYSKTLQDDHIADFLLTDGATKVENARHIRNAIENALKEGQ